ncbi:MAG: class I SAM-dependent methyltransferase [Peptoniphilus lacydonensis]|jgi:SAM-dependent methyltransferase|uniref:tRNA (adenine(22)-N(1))-methyltransferase n=1 Tax=Peptoniphilus TaxID=162289 RepID=UPI00258EEC3C|nr:MULTISPECIES: class I SAM-dependent methyltransferase [Peptoniphilus]MDU2115232.1 class I SAM-dependent methyltransferase [Peptoniphilus lacydonensis]MDU5595576.1 class I SAM-dependent methyltransferase [Peptoniphilus rhinitidis]MDU7301971.1 class I SAM-dependent methyltransferase [Peptoniphilus lacydonensis]
MIKLSNRLKKIAELVDFGASVIDVGTDHGYVPNFLCEENISKDIIATDISKNSLEKSIELTKKLNNEKCIRNILANGIVNEKRENIIIAGLGGIQIADIILDSFEIAKDAEKLILQPMQKTNILRRELFKMGFEIIDEEIIFEDERFFEIIVAKYSRERKFYSEEYFYFSEKLIEKKDKTYLEFLKERERNIKNIMKSFNCNNKRAEKRKGELYYLLKKTEEAIYEISCK